MTETPDTPDDETPEPPQRIFAGGRIWTREADAALSPIGFELALIHGHAPAEPAKEEE